MHESVRSALDGEHGETAIIIGYVVSVRKSSRTIFADVRDYTNVIQLVMERESLSESDWNSCKRLKAHHRISAEGSVGSTRSGQKSIYASVKPTVLGRVNGAIHDLDLQLSIFANQLLLSRMRFSFQKLVADLGYIEIEPRVLSSDWPKNGLEALRVNYPGFGSHATLATSPANQLREFMLATGNDRVFAISRCFSSTFRIENSSSEALIGMGYAKNLTVDSLVDLLIMIPERVVAAVGVSHVASKFTEQTDLHIVRSDSDPLSPHVAASYQRVLEVCGNPGPHHVKAVIRMSYPPGIVVAEGAVETIGGYVNIATFCIHFEQLLSLFSDLPARNLRSLGRFELWTEGIGEYN